MREAPRHAAVLPLVDAGGSQTRRSLPLVDAGGSQTRGSLPLVDAGGFQTRGSLPLVDAGGSQTRGSLPLVNAGGSQTRSSLPPVNAGGALTPVTDHFPRVTDTGSVGIFLQGPHPAPPRPTRYRFGKWSRRVRRPGALVGLDCDPEDPRPVRNLSAFLSIALRIHEAGFNGPVCRIQSRSWVRLILRGR